MTDCMTQQHGRSRTGVSNLSVICAKVFYKI